MTNPSKALAAYYATAVVALVATIIVAIAFVDMVATITPTIRDYRTVGTHQTVNPQNTVNGTVLQGGIQIEPPLEKGATK